MSWSIVGWEIAGRGVGVVVPESGQEHEGIFSCSIISVVVSVVLLGSVVVISLDHQIRVDFARTSWILTVDFHSLSHQGLVRALSPAHRIIVFLLVRA